MKHLACFVFSLAMLVITCYAFDDINAKKRRPPPPPPSPPPPPPSPYNHMQVVWLWSPVYCRSKPPCKPAVSRRFYLHGLWPANSSGFTIERCSGSQQMGKSVRNLMTHVIKDLERSWPSVGGMTDDEFWCHEYNKHGICSEDVLGSVRKYFDSVIKVGTSMNYNILNILAKGGISPSPSIKYTIAEIEAAVQQTFPSIHIYISCWFDPTSRQLQLKEIYICFDQLVKSPVSCPPNTDTKNCGAPSSAIFIPLV